MTVGERIKSKRVELGLSQDELAKRCGYKSRSSINKIELSRDLPLRKVVQMAKALGCSATYLMGWEEESKYSHIDTAAVAEMMLEPSNKELIGIINEMNLSQKKELLHYANFLLNSKKDDPPIIDY